MSRKHIIKTGPNAGRWGKCEAAEGACPNKTMHVSSTALSAIQAWKSAEAGKRVGQNSLTEKDVLDFAKLDPATQRKFVSETMFDTIKFRKPTMEDPTVPKKERINYTDEDIQYVSEMDTLMDTYLERKNRYGRPIASTTLELFTQRGLDAEKKGLAPAGFTEWMRERTETQFRYGEEDKRAWHSYITGMVGDRIKHAVKTGRPIPQLRELQEWSDNLMNSAKEVLDGDMEYNDKKQAFRKLKAEADPNAKPVVSQAKTTIKVIQRFLDDWHMLVPRQDYSAEGTLDHKMTSILNNEKYHSKQRRKGSNR